MEVFKLFLSGLISSGLVVTAAVYLFKSALEKKLQKEVEQFKSGLASELEGLKAGLALKLEEARSEFRKGESERHSKFQELLDFRARQLREFYWPVYFGLQKDNVVWRRILDKRDSKDELQRSVGGVIERDVVLPNHARLVSVIEENLYLAEADAELEKLLLAYVRHVAVYTSIRTAGEELIFPIKEGEAWPQGLFPAIESRLRSLQADYNRLLDLQESAGQRLQDAEEPE